MITRLLVFFALTSTGLLAQGGDSGDKRMDPVVPEATIPPSPFLPVAEALKSFKLAPGFEIEAVVAEPLVEKPICLDFDPAGRMWVCEMLGYMADIDAKGEEIPSGRIVILEDTDRDGSVDKRTVFLENCLLPRAISVYEDGVLFIDQEKLCWVKRKGDSPDGPPQVIDTKFAKAGNVEHKANGLLSNLDNYLYLAKSGLRLRRTGDTWQQEFTATRGQWGIARDDYGHLYHSNNSTLLFGDLIAPNLLQGNPGARMKYTDFVELGSNQVWPIRVTPGVNRAYMAVANGYKQDTLDPATHKLINATAAAGMAIYRGTNFPADWYGMAFTAEPSANLIKAIRVTATAGTLKGEHPLGENEFLASTDERFRPVSLYNAPDGSLYVLDIYHGIIQHKTYMTTYLRQQILSRGLAAPSTSGGRIYRIRSSSGKLESSPELATLTTAELVNGLLSRNVWQREAAQRLLVSRKDPASIPLLTELSASGAALAKIHAFWTLEGIGALKAEHLVSALQSRDSNLQSSALWASTRLSPAELELLKSPLLAVVPAAPEVIPYLARAIGPLHSAEAYQRLVSLIQTQPPVSFTRQAVVSGLDQHELEFLAALPPEFNDPELSGWLRQAANAPQASAVPDTLLRGAALASFNRGKALYHGEATCFGCHGADGAGVANLGPPLDASEWVTGKPATLINILLHGLTGPVKVDGQLYHPSADMPGLDMNPLITDQALADIATYIRNEWSNSAPLVNAQKVKTQRVLTKSREGRAWTAGELKP
jgi:glucose/arabinose dehydrogenase/mono/diheme cytochrome c family protein